MANKSKKGFNGIPQARERRTRVITRLEAQLKRGMRSPKKNEQTLSDVPLLDKDIARIEKELSILKTRI
jgi:hypothetical protein